MARGYERDREGICQGLDRPVQHRASEVLRSTTHKRELPSRHGADGLQQSLLSLQAGAGNRTVSAVVAQLAAARNAEKLGAGRLNEAMIQRVKVSDDHVGDDLRHPQAARLFTEETMDWWNDLERPKKAAKITDWTTAQVRTGRVNIAYEQLRNTTLKSAQSLRTWLGKDAEEYMYVHKGTNIYTGGRDREKLPHPTLVGGDPDVKCAGTMLLDLGKRTVRITNESGHFRPRSVASGTVTLVQGLLPKPSGKGQAPWKVETREV